jgi:hypothetical protein
MINERPNIVATITTEDGYRARGLCLVDGFPAEVTLDVDTHRQKYSRFDIRVFDPVRMSWEHIYKLDSEEVGRLPILGNEPETIVQLNEVANLLWQAANVVLFSARVRQEQIDTADHVRDALALEDARAARCPAPVPAKEDELDAPVIHKGEFVQEGEPVEDEEPFTGATEEEQG